MEEVNITINHRNTVIQLEDIVIFSQQNGGGRGSNGSRNTRREYIIYSIINNHIPDGWYGDERWLTIKNALLLYLNTHISDNIQVCTLLGGRGNNYDFAIDGHQIEFKFNANLIHRLPQILSLTSNRIDLEPSYIEYFYDRGYLHQISDLYSIQVPERGIWLSNVHKTNYNIPSVPFFRQLYDNEREHLSEKKIIVDNSINDYLMHIRGNINYEEITRILLPQSYKNFMLYKDGIFHYDRIKYEECNVISLNKLNRGNTLILNTQQEGTTIHLLLRWRNHAGILMPAWQIKIGRV